MNGHYWYSFIGENQLPDTMEAREKAYNYDLRGGQAGLCLLLPLMCSLIPGPLSMQHCPGPIVDCNDRYDAHFSPRL